MKKRFLAVLVTGLFFLGMAGMANASLTTIGTATYGGSDYNLIWDADNNGSSVIWLDYSHTPRAVWDDQMNWAAGLGSDLTYNFGSAYNVAWDEAAWRLSSAGVNPQGGYNQTTSEMGHLFYDELGLTHYPPQITDEDLNATNFDHLKAFMYWSGTEYVSDEDKAWRFSMEHGRQGSAPKNNNGHGLAVRNADVSAVPVPGAVWLLASGLAALVGLRKKRLVLSSAI